MLNFHSLGNLQGDDTFMDIMVDFLKDALFSKKFLEGGAHMLRVDLLRLHVMIG